MTTLAEQLHAETVMLDAAERAADISTGLIPVDAVRPLTAAERRSGVNFRLLAEDVNTSAQTIAQRALADRQLYVVILTSKVTEIAQQYGINAARIWLADVDGPVVNRQLLGVRELVDTATTAHAATLTRTAETGWVRMLEEAARQGVRGIPDNAPVVDRTAIQALARRIAQGPLADVTRRITARAYVPGQDDVTSWLRLVEQTGVDAPTAGVETDYARNMAHQAQQHGRGLALAALPPPATVYASELLDGRTCGNAYSGCMGIDGHEYATLADAQMDYPLRQGGGYVGCFGGPRCRGTLVTVYGEDV